MENRRPLIAGNWKMFKTCPEAVETAGRLVELVTDATDIDIMIAPPFTALSSVWEVIKTSPVHLGAQNFFWEPEGAYTGEISASMIKSTGCTYVIIGHSERRLFYGETDESVNKKIKAATAANLIPVLCVGETEKERESKKTFSVLDKQVQKGLEGFVSDELKELVVAYEPVWAIGTGKTATTDQAQEAHYFLRSLIEKKFGNVLANSVRILYGGSVKPGNIAELMAMPDLDGALVGGASLSAETFSEIVHFQK
ncbi:MAG: triose-phosphate isomerase [Deltaproteobacteria bacterium]|nr:triose-phosphate isomerase [Deltaproteobacteria bacterium]MBW2099267.1 triose-phosphate isomerase [Deltaproteobacteria bacterium]